MKNLFFTLLFALPFYAFCQIPQSASDAVPTTASSVHMVKDKTYASAESQFARSAYGLEQRLPLRSFIAKAHHVSVLLSWGVDRPVGNTSFIIERALKSTNWEPVGMVSAVEGQQEFSFWDVRVEPGEVYRYRLVNRSDNGIWKASEPVLLNVDRSADEFLIILGLIGFIGYIAYQARNLGH